MWVSGVFASTTRPSSKRAVEDRLVAVLPAGHPLLAAPATLAQLAAEPFVLYPGNPRPSYADHVIALFDAHGLGLKVAQWTNELQTAIGLVGAGIGVTLVPASVQVLHRATSATPRWWRPRPLRRLS